VDAHAAHGSGRFEVQAQQRRPGRELALVGAGPQQIDEELAVQALFGLVAFPVAGQLEGEDAAGRS